MLRVLAYMYFELDRLILISELSMMLEVNRSLAWQCSLRQAWLVCLQSARISTTCRPTSGGEWRVWNVSATLSSRTTN